MKDNRSLVGRGIRSAGSKIILREGSSTTIWKMGEGVTLIYCPSSRFGSSGSGLARALVHEAISTIIILVDSQLSSSDEAKRILPPLSLSDRNSLNIGCPTTP